MTIGKADGRLNRSTGQDMTPSAGEALGGTAEKGHNWLRSLRRTRTIGGLTLGCAVILTACGSSAKAATPPSSNVLPTKGVPAAAAQNARLINSIKEDPTLAALVPKSWRAKKSIVMVTSATNGPPDSFYPVNSTTIVGRDPDIGYAVAKVLGLKLSVVDAQFADIIPGIQSGRYDLAISAASVSAAREKVVNFVTDFQSGYNFLVKTGTSVHPTSLSSLCGLSVAVPVGSEQAVMAQEQSTSCSKAGKRPLRIQQYGTNSATLLAVSSGRAQVQIGDPSSNAYEAKLFPGKFQISGHQFAVTPEGIVLPKNSGTIGKAVEGAMNLLISDGKYGQILRNWGVGFGAISHASLLPTKAQG